MMKFLKTLVKIILVFAIIIVILLVLAMKFLIKEKTSITAQDFFKMMATEDFAVDEISDDLEEYGVSLEKAFKAHHSNCEIVFYELTSEEDAKTLFGVCKEEMKSSHYSSSMGSSEGNYQIYETNTTDSWKYVIRVENTVLFVECDMDERPYVRDLLEKMGYGGDWKKSSYTFDKTKYYG